MENISFITAFLAGIGAFFTPCVFPLIPSYISYLTGLSFGELSGDDLDKRKKEIRIRTAAHSLSFILGFSVVFVIVGLLLNFLGALIFQDRILLKRIAGGLIIVFGLAIMGVLKIPFLRKQKSFSYRKTGVSVIGSFLVGATFALAWSPCLGPFIASVMAYVSSAPDMASAAKILIAFSFGLGVPFFCAALLINSFLVYIKRIEKYIRKIEIIAGVILVIFGILLITGGV
ncbi:cytochrome c biogenesis CcdA family protein [Candidatus Omnitrophota bacterium]